MESRNAQTWVRSEKSTVYLEKAARGQNYLDVDCKNECTSNRKMWKILQKEHLSSPVEIMLIQIFRIRTLNGMRSGSGMPWWSVGNAWRRFRIYSARYDSAFANSACQKNRDSSYTRHCCCLTRFFFDEEDDWWIDYELFTRMFDRFFFSKFAQDKRCDENIFRDKFELWDATR